MRFGPIAAAVLLGSSCSTPGDQAGQLVQTPPSRLSAHVLSEAAAITMIRANVQDGDEEAEAVLVLVRAGFACRPLSEGEYGRISPEHVKEWTCWIAADRTNAGYKLVYAGLAINPRGRVIRVGAGSYPVIYRNLRIDGQGRTIVVQDPKQWNRP